MQKRVALGGAGKQRALRWALYAAAVLALSFAFAYGRIFLLDYNPIDGDFQSYNVFRRMLAGQAPIRDFANYIGMAPVLFNLPWLLFNGNFAASLFVTNFTCNVLFSLCALLVLWLITENAPFSMLVSAAIPKLVSSGVAGLLGGAGAYFNSLYTNLYTPSNSMRIARIFWPFLLVFLSVAFGAWHRRRYGSGHNLVAAVQNLRFCAVLGALAGLGITWSNDFGLAVAFSATVLVALLLVFGYRGSKDAPLHWPKRAARFGVFLVCLATGALLSMTLAAGGNPMAWLRFTAGVGEYQYFYFNGASGRALLPVVFKNPRLMAYTAAYVAFLVWCLVGLIRGRLSNRALLGGFLALSTLVATYVYILSGSGYNFTEALEGFFWLAVCGGALRLALWLLRAQQRRVVLAGTALLAAVSLLFCGLAGRDVLRQRSRPREGVYVQALGGYVNYPQALGGLAGITGNDEVFSVYATGLEAVKGQFQPTGYDYIIHALGGDARRAYLDAFEKGEFRWAQTMALGIERWLSVENWDFYRLVAARYTRHTKTEYSWLWERTGVDLAQTPQQACATLAVHWQDGRAVLEVTAPPGSNFTADVKVAYTTAFSSPGGAFLSLGRRCVAVAVPDPVGSGDTVWGYFAGENDALYIPVFVRDGHGSATLVPSDVDYVTLDVCGVELAGVLPDLHFE